MAHSRFGAATRWHTYIYKNGSDSLLRVRQRNELASDGLSFVRGSATICHSSPTATDATSPTLPGKTAFLGNNRAVNGRSACLGDSGRNKSAEYFVSNGVANARDCQVGYEKFAAYRNSLGKFSKSYRHEDSDCQVGYEEFAAYRNGLGKFTKSYHHGDSDCQVEEFAADRSGLGKFTKSYR